MIHGPGVKIAMPVTDASVRLWGKTIGAVSWVEDRQIGVFQYARDFLKSGIEIAPIMMPLKEYPYDFPSLPRDTFKGLPGLLVDSLPDSFGNAIINEWLASQSRNVESFNPVERLCYVGKRGMGALEFEPATRDSQTSKQITDIQELVVLANSILDERNKIGGVFSGEDDRDAIENIVRVGTSAGGARAKAILAWNPNTNEFRSGQVDLKDGFEHWILKFDGVKNNRDKDLVDPQGYGLIEYCYYLIAQEAGIIMSPCRLHREGGRSHFMTKRFDRLSNGSKVHMQSLGAIAHFDYNQPSSYSYEQAIGVMKRLNLPRKDIIQFVIRAVFNVIGQNNDDHVKNIAFLMDKAGNWRLSPAFDMIYSWNPNGLWTGQHQMSVNGKRRDISRLDLLELAEFGGIKKKKANDLIDRVKKSFLKWPMKARVTGIEDDQISKIEGVLLTNI